MIEPPDTFHLSAAIGWLGLGNPSEASAELEKITPRLHATPEILNVFQSIYLSQLKWLEADAVARTLIDLEPGVAWHWTNLAYAVRRKPEGSIAEAKEVLLQAAKLFPRDSLICYNLSCYESQLGNLTQAKVWLDRAYEVGHRRQLQQMAMKDPDLAPLRKEFNLSL